MSSKASKVKQDKDAPAPPAKVHSELKGMNFYVNDFGEVISTVAADKINSFLDRHVNDKKLKNKEDKGK